MTLFSALLFFVLTPGIVLSLPPKGSKVVVALTHAVVFALIYSLTHKMVYQFLYEGFAATPAEVAARKKADADEEKKKVAAATARKQNKM